MVEQQVFIENIAKRLGHPTSIDKPPHPYKGSPPFWTEFELPLEEKIAMFSQNWRRVGGHVERFPDLQAVKTWIAEQSTALQAQLILRQNDAQLNELNLETFIPEATVVVWDQAPVHERIAIAAGADIGIIVADHAVAYTGSIVATSSGAKGRSVSLLPTVLFAIVPVERMKLRLGEVLAPLDDLPREQLPAGFHVISGPSRSADIENDLTIGVHGPGIVYALLVG
jgi:L-lactate dehydrogenase complex protein LldG